MRALECFRMVPSWGLRLPAICAVSPEAGVTWHEVALLQRTIPGNGFRGELWATKSPSSWENGCLSSEVPGPSWDPGGVGRG